MSQVDAGGERYSGSYVSHLESGRRQPTPEVAEYLAGRLGVPASELLGADPQTFIVDAAAKDMLQADLSARSAWLEQDFEQARREAERAADAARRTGRLDSWWGASCLRAQSMLAVGEYAPCWELAEMLADHPVAQDSGAMRAEMLVLASKARRAEGMLREAAQRAETAIVYASGPPTAATPLAHAYMAAISAMMEIGRTEEAAGLADRLRVVRDRVESTQTLGLIAWTLGNLDFQAGAVVRALHEHALAQDLLRPEANLRSWGRFRYSSATLRLAAGIRDGVRELLESASLALRLVGHSGDVCELEMAYAKLAIAEADFPQALERCDRALAEAAAMPSNRLGELEVLRATALCSLPDLPQARDTLARAAAQFETAGAYRRALDVWRMRSELAAHTSGDEPHLDVAILAGQP